MSLRCNYNFIHYYIVPVFAAGFHRELTANQTFPHQELKLSDGPNSCLSCMYVTG